MSYTTIYEYATDSFTDKKSEFIWHICPVKTQEEAVRFIEYIKGQHRKARHNVYAYVLRDGNASRYSDDGEPQGTGGVPVLDVINKAGLTDVCVVVTRYFGGTLLGTGGLVRSYTQAARAAMEDAETVRMCLCRKLAVTVEYGALDRLLYELRRREIEMGETEYGAKVTLHLTVEEESADALQDTITALTSGGAVIGTETKGFFPISRKSEQR